MMINNNSGYVLPSVLFISLLVTSLLLGILTIIFFYNSLNQKLINKKKLDLACFSALQVFISTNQEISKEDVFISVDSNLVRLRSKLKGLFTEVEATAFSKTDSSKVKYLLGSQVEGQFNNAVIISKGNLRASVAGNTKIIGDMFLTSDKIKIGRISGIKSASKNYLNGEIIIKEEIKTKLFNENIVLDQFRINGLNKSSSYFDGNYELNNQTITKLLKSPNIKIGGDLIISGVIKLTKKISAIKIIVTGKVEINKNSYSTIDMKIISDSSIIVKENSILENIILSAKSKITIEKNTQFKNVQLFSQKEIECNNANFKFPSIFAVYSNIDEESNLNNKINIHSSIINGSILLINSTTGIPNNKNLIEIDAESRIHGLVYSENNVKIASPIFGIVYTNSFWYYKEPTEYLNWLVNVKVDREKLDESFLLPVGFTKVNNYRILKETWIN